MLTNGVDDAAISVVSTVQGGQFRNSFLSKIMLQKESFIHEHTIMLRIFDAKADIFFEHWERKGAAAAQQQIKPL